jgi:hypothetical protein
MFIRHRELHLHLVGKMGRMADGRDCLRRKLVWDWGLRNIDGALGLHRLETVALVNQLYQQNIFSSTLTNE